MRWRGFDIRSILRLLRQRRRKRKLQRELEAYQHTYGLYRLSHKPPQQDLIIPYWHCGNTQCEFLGLYQEQQWLRGVAVRYTTVADNTKQPDCSNCVLREEALKMREQVEQMMQQEMLIEPYTARMRVLLRLFLNVRDCSDGKSLEG